MKNKLIKTESLNQIFEKNKVPETYTYTGKCSACEGFVKIEITRTSGGYGLFGGILYETIPEKYIALCINCYEKMEKGNVKLIN